MPRSLPNACPEPHVWRCLRCAPAAEPRGRGCPCHRGGQGHCVEHHQAVLHLDARAPRRRQPWAEALRPCAAVCRDRVRPQVLGGDGLLCGLPVHVHQDRGGRAGARDGGGLPAQGHALHEGQARPPWLQARAVLHPRQRRRLVDKGGGRCMEKVRRDPRQARSQGGSCPLSPFAF